MARPSNLTKMSVEALIKMRDEIIENSQRQGGRLQSQLAALADGGWMGAARRRSGVQKGVAARSRDESRAEVP